MTTKEKIIHKLQTGTNEEILQAIQDIRRYSGADVTRVLIELMRSEDIYISERAEEILDETSSESSVPVLLKALDDENRKIRIAAAEVLSLHSVYDAIPKLFEFFDDPHPFVQLQAIESFGYLMCKTAVHKIIPYLYSNDILHQRFAAAALGRIRDISVVKELEKARRIVEEEVDLYEDPDDYYSVIIDFDFALYMLGDSSKLDALFDYLRQGHYLPTAFRLDDIAGLPETSCEVKNRILEELQKALKRHPVENSMRFDSFRDSVRSVERQVQKCGEGKIK